MWFFVKEDTFFYIREDGVQSPMVNRIQPVNPGRGLVSVQFVEGPDKQFKLEDFHPVNKASRPFEEVQHSRGLFCQKFNETVMEIGQNWSGKKEFNQVTVRGCFYLPDKEIREALLKLRDIGEAAFKEYVDLKMEKKKTSKKQQQQQQPSTDWEKKYEDLKQKYQSLEEEMTALKEENEVLKNKVQVLKDTAEKKSEETSENTPEGKTTQMKKRIRGPVKEVATNKKARTENEKGQFKVGDKVWARFKKDGIMYPAQITANKDNRYDVIFDEDQEEQTCTAEEMKLLKAL